MGTHRFRVFALLLHLGLPQWSAMAKPPIAKTALGDLIGRVQNGVATWSGVPYARAHRWMPPVAPRQLFEDIVDQTPPKPELPTTFFKKQPGDHSQ